MARRVETDGLDDEVIKAMIEWPSQVATYVIRNRLDWPGKPLHRKGLETRHVLTALRRLERRGLVCEVPSSYAVMKEWRLVSPAPRTDGRRDE